MGDGEMASIKTIDDLMESVFGRRLAKDGRPFSEHGELVAEVTEDERARNNAVDAHGRTPLHYAAKSNLPDEVNRLIARGAEVSPVDQDGMTPLHVAMIHNAVDAASQLLGHGASMTATNTRGQTAMACCLQSCHVDREGDIMPILEVLVLHAPLGETILPPAMPGDVDTVDDRLALIEGWMEERPRHGHLLTHFPVEVFEAGASDIRAYFKGLNAAPRLMPHEELEEAERLLSRVSTTVEATTHRVIGGGQANPSGPRVIIGGSEPNRYIDNSDCKPSAYYRKKICVLGPSGVGKTSLIKTLTTQRPTLEPADERTVGIDLFGWSFDVDRSHKGPHRYDISVWDFAGQDEYQAAHSLFYSARTLNLVCVDLRAYCEVLAANPVETCGDPSAVLDAYVTQHVYKHIRSVCDHIPASEFVLVGTKTDRIDDDQVEAVLNADLMARISRINADALRQLDRAIDELKVSLASTASSRLLSSARTQADERKLAALQRMRKQNRPNFLDRELLFTSSADADTVSRLRHRIQGLVTYSGSSFLMPPAYAAVAAFLKQRAQQAFQRSDTAIDRVFVRADWLQQLLRDEPQFESLDASDVTAILHVLHELGEILWFDKSCDALRETVFLSPALVIDFVRKVVNHELAGDLSKRLEHQCVREEGRITHALLSTLKLWRDVDSDALMLQLKQLLFRFQLAYPADSVLRWNSDLIVPIYWKHQPLSQHAVDVHAPSLASTALLPSRVCWEYVFHTGLPDTLFEQLCVSSYSAHFSSARSLARDAFETTSGGHFYARVSRRLVEAGTVAVLRVDVAAKTLDLAWPQLVWYGANVEKLLEAYPGLWVTRFTLDPEHRRFEVDYVLAERQERQRATEDATGSTAVVADATDTMLLLPPSMEWYTQKQWRTPRSKKVSPPDQPVGLSQLEALVVRLGADIKGSVSSDIQALQQSLFTLSAAEGNRRDYPALWTLLRHDDGRSVLAKYELQLRSHLSGKCFHAPIVLTVPGDVFAKYGVVIKTGLSVLSSVVPDMLGKGVIECVAAAASDHVSRAMQVHSLVGGLRLTSNTPVDMANDRTLSPDETVLLLRDLLRVFDPLFDPLKMSKLSELECGIVRRTGECVWAHRDEIQSRHDEIQFRHDYLCTAPTSSPQPLQPLSLVAQPLPPLETQRPAHEAAAAVLRIVGAAMLPRVRTIRGTQSPFCKWRLIDMVSQRIVAKGQTQRHKRAGKTPNWNDQAFFLPRTTDAKTPLSKCALLFVVKVATMGSLTETIAEGSFVLSESALQAQHDVGSPRSVLLSAKGRPAGVLTFQLHA